ncbi:cyclin-dependent kinase 2-interacting protein isoform X2 [Calypte anna]|uniref:cyclin-dependent kinase 2-interacting protein isoform X2 n=1 Tax=Calypte anna TaxID=9244 RepID=UPI0011C48B78|nr:cyclin-dependent kinase 2-interacting protein isoform X2 [Calypte anna]
MAAKSPADSTPRRPVLSVSARKLKDNAADWHNLMMKWERLNDNGFTTANKIVNMKISEQFQDNKLKIECDSSATESEKTAPKYNEELDSCCAELLETLKHMTKIQLKMEKLTSTSKAICDLETFHHGAGNCTAPFFHTWPTTYFCQCAWLFNPFQMRFLLSSLKCTRRNYSSSKQLYKKLLILLTRI